MENLKVSSLEEQLEKDFLTTLKAKSDEVLISVLRLLKTAIHNAEIAKKDKLTEAEIQKVIASEVKKRQDAIELYQQAGREDLLTREEKELGILKKYLPEQLGEEEIKNLVQKIIAAAGEVTAKDFGKIMGQVMAQTQGRADGGLVSRLVKEALTPS